MTPEDQQPGQQPQSQPAGEGALPSPVTNLPNATPTAQPPTKPPRTPRRRTQAQPAQPPQPPQPAQPPQPVQPNPNVQPRSSSRKPRATRPRNQATNGTDSSTWSRDLLKPATRNESTKPEDTKLLDIIPPIKEVDVNRDFYREQAAKDIARWLIGAFVIALTLAFGVMILLIIPIYWTSTETMTDKFMPAMPNVLEIVKIIGGIFSPLLAFILGYYFSLSTKSSQKSE